jgi:hypothetical protein
LAEYASLFRPTVFNAFKRIAAQYSEPEKTALFSKTATDF